MRIAFFNTRSYDRTAFLAAGSDLGHHLTFFEAHLNQDTAPLAQDYGCVCAFINDVLDAPVLEILKRGGTELIALRSAGFNNVDLRVAADLGLRVVRVPAYSPESVAEHAVGLVLTLSRKFHRAYNRVRENNFALDGLEGFMIHGKTVGVIGTGRIGAAFARIMLGFGSTVLAYDPVRVDPVLHSAGVQYCELHELLSRSDIVSLHCPLTPESRYLINAGTLTQIKHGAMLINTSRGGLLDTAAVIEALKTGRLGYLGLDVYEQEGDLFFEDLSSTIVQDDLFQRLLTFPNVVITGHQAFFTHEALHEIALTTLQNIDDVAAGRPCANELHWQTVCAPARS